MWKPREISSPWASHAATNIDDGMERKGNVTSETLEIRPSALTWSARCVALSRRRSISRFSRRRPVGGGSGVGSTPLSLHQSSPMRFANGLLLSVSNVEVSTLRSNDYSKNVGINSEWKAMLLNKVVVGSCKRLNQDDNSLTEPPSGYNSVSIFGQVLLRVH